MRAFLMNTKGLSEDEAISLMSIAVDFGVTQVVDGNWGIHAILKKSLFAGGERVRKPPEKGLVDLAMLAGCCHLVCGVLNVFVVPAPCTGHGSLVWRVDLENDSRAWAHIWLQHDRMKNRPGAKRQEPADLAEFVADGRQKDDFLVDEAASVSLRL